MRRAGAIAALALSAVLLAACANGGGRERYRDGSLRPVPIALPGDVIATELAFARMAQDEGQWTAFAEYATEDAVMFVPGPVNAQQWLKGQANPAQAVKWQPHTVWSSCDGSLAATKGAWQRPDGSVGYFTTVWQRQDDRTYKWVMDQGDGLAEPLEAPDMIGAIVADCQTPVRTPPVDRMPLAGDPTGRSRDGTLKWTVFAETDGGRTVSVEYWDGATWRSAFVERVAAQ